MSAAVLPPGSQPLLASPGSVAPPAPPGAPPVGPSWVPAPPTAPQEPPSPPPPGLPSTGAGGSGSRPPEPPRPQRTPPFARPTRLIAVLVAAVAVAFDLAAHQRAASLASTLLVGIAVLALVVSGRIRNRQALVLGFAAVAIALFLSLRASEWLIPLDVVAAGTLVVLTAVHATGGSITSVTGATLVVRSGRFIGSLLLAPAHALACAAVWLPARSERRRDHLVAVARGVGLALPVVVVLALLLASADVVFASLFSVPDDLGSVAGHVALFGLGVMVASALFVEASASGSVEVPSLGAPIGPTEATVVLGAIAALYGAFAAVQVVTGRGGATHVIETAGLTYADHAREGFFQLLAVAAITLVVLSVLRAGTRRGSRGQRLAVVVLSEVVVALTLVILAVALERLRLYEGAYGATMLRLSSTVFAWWLGVVLLLVAAATAGLGRTRSWLVAAVVLSALVALVGWNVVNPERLVVERNVALAEAGERDLDIAYLWTLSDDAVPAIAEALPVVDVADRSDVLARVCTVIDRRGVGFVPEIDDVLSGRPPGIPVAGFRTTPGAGAPGGPDAPTGLGANRSAARAAEVRSEVCPR